MSLSLLCLCLLMSACKVVAADPAPQCNKESRLKLSVAATGIHLLRIDDIRRLTGCTDLQPANMQLSSQGRAIQYAVSGGPSGDDDQAGMLLFRAEQLAGEHSWLNEFSSVNTYWLQPFVTGSTAASPTQAKPVAGEMTVGTAAPPRSWVHMEKDEVRVRFTARADDPRREVWFWKRLNSIDPEPFEVPLDLRQLDDPQDAVIRIGMRGWSSLPVNKYPGIADHRIEVVLNGQAIGSGEWFKQDEHVIELTDLPADLLRRGRGNQLSLRVAKRVLEGEQQAVVDAVLLNWIEVEYRHTGRLRLGQHHLKVAHEDGGWFQIRTRDLTPPTVMSGDGHLLVPVRIGSNTPWRSYRYLTSETNDVYSVAVGDAFMELENVVLDSPSKLRDTGQQADYLMISHHSLIETVKPLAEFHRQNGLNVALIDVEDIYDEFNHGILAPAAIRDFISFAYHHWQQPRPRFVLLVGDASWDVRNQVGIDTNYADWTFRPWETTRFGKNKSHSYADGVTAADRNLVPTWPVATHQGYAASDNVFVAVDGEDFLPDLAIGRFPIRDPQDAAAIVEKTIAYHMESGVGPWRRNILWITNENRGLQHTSDRLDDTLGGHGFTGTKIYPSAEEKGNQAHQAMLRSTLDEGQLLVHFIGHGGRYIWRTGPPDYRKNHDLFTLDHLDELTPTTRLPFILSMTCYSAPFDHPTADSIGEKFLRVPGRGAIGVLAASWRNSPNRNFSEAMLEQLTRPGSMGEAVMRAKQKKGISRLMVETYNLLGDPATRLALPQRELKLKSKQRDDYIKLSGKVAGKSFHGQVLIDWLDTSGTPIGQEIVKLKRGKFKFRLEPEHGLEISKIRAYAWNTEEQVDALGGVVLVATPEEEHDQQRRERRERRKQLIRERQKTQAEQQVQN